MVVALIRKRMATSTDEQLASWNSDLALYRQDNGDWPDPDQVRLRAIEYPKLFQIGGTKRGAVIRLRMDLEGTG